MPENRSHDRKVYHILTKLIKFVVVEGITYVHIDLTCHKGMNSTKMLWRLKLLDGCCSGQIWHQQQHI